MARMIPPQLQLAESEAENKLYRAFEEQLDDDYVVLHSVAWQRRDPRRGARDGEIDFVIAHPELGILALEVKGGRITRNGSDWFTNDFKLNKSPFEQVKNNRYKLGEFLSLQPFWQNSKVTVGYAVAFPDITVTDQSLSLDAPRQIVMDGDDILKLAQWVPGVFHYWHGDRTGTNEPGQEFINSVVQLLSPSFTFRRLLSTEFGHEKIEFERLTREQYRVLDMLQRQRRTAISGCAGSGKTVLAMEKAGFMRLNFSEFSPDSFNSKFW